MRYPVLFILAAFLLVAGFSASGNPAASIVVTGLSCTSIQSAINALPAGGGQVIIPAGLYTCTLPIVIDRDNVSLQGEGTATVLRLANDANSPVLILGQAVAVPTTTRRNIRVSNLAIDGNRTNQTFECRKGPCSPTNPLRNNCITLRRVEDALIERVTVFRAKSGGLVTELNCRRITIRDFTSSDNEFDGLAGYQTEDSSFSGLYLYDNRAAGGLFSKRTKTNVLRTLYFTAVGYNLKLPPFYGFSGFSLTDS